MKKKEMSSWWAATMFFAACLCFVTPWPSYAIGPYVDIGGMTVLDQATGLEWQQMSDGGRVNWQQALGYCENLELGGNADWRLPNVRELQSIMVKGNPQATNTILLQTRYVARSSGWDPPFGQEGLFWTSTTSSGLLANAFGIPFLESWGFPSERIVTRSKMYPGYVRCVRSWSDGTFGPMALSGLSSEVGGIKGGMTVVVHGSRLGTEQNGGSVSFGGLAATILSWSSSQIVAVIPPHSAGVVDVVVTTVDGQNSIMPSAFTYVADMDGDGWPVGDDADDADNTVYPGAPELCDGKDNDQDGQIDGQTRATSCGVGVCAGNTGIETCASGAWGGDTCNPVLGAVAEICDGIDNDCDGQADEGLTSVFYQDADLDSFGDPLQSIDACSQQPGFVAGNTDCNDSDPLINPGAVDSTVDGVDQNCDGTDGPIRATLAFPAIKDGPHADGLWMNFISIQAYDPSQRADVTFSLYESNGALRLSVTERTPLNGSLVKTPNWLLHAALDVEPFDGTVVVSANLPILGLVNTISPSEKAYDTYEAPLTAATLYFPSVYDNESGGNGYRNIIHLQNTNAAPVDIAVSYQDDWNGTVVDTVQIPAHGEYERQVSEVFGGDFNGTIQVDANAELAGMLRFEYMANGIVEATTIYEATLERQDIYFPYINDGAGNANYYSVMNTSNVAANCSFDFYPPIPVVRPKPCLPGLACIQVMGVWPDFTDGPVTIAPGERYTTTPSWARYGDLTHAFSGSMVGRCDQPVAAITNVITAGTAGYNAYESTVTRDVLIFPQVYDNINGYENELHLQNGTASSSSSVVIELFFTDGTLLGTVAATLPPYGKYILSSPLKNTPANEIR